MCKKSIFHTFRDKAMVQGRVQPVQVTYVGICYNTIDVHLIDVKIGDTFVGSHICLGDYLLMNRNAKMHWRKVLREMKLKGGRA